MFFLSIVFLFSSLLSHADEQVTTIYGECTVAEPVLCELLQSSAFQRLKGINQYGILSYIHKSRMPYTRYTHSLGVFYLLRTYGASLEEQIAGLLHDASHTVFSHVGDHLIHIPGQLVNQNDEAYQDKKHIWILSQTDIKPILEKHGYTLEQINPKSGKFHMLEAELPDLCADRIEYNLYGGYAEGWLSLEEIQTVLQSLSYKNGAWIFDDAAVASIIAEVSLRLCQELFTSRFNFVSYHCTARALMRAVEIDQLSQNDILYEQDDAVLACLQLSDDEQVRSYISAALNAKKVSVESLEQDSNLSFIGKFRGVNPRVQVNGICRTLSEIDPIYREKFELIRNAVGRKKHYCIRGIK